MTQSPHEVLGVSSILTSTDKLRVSGGFAGNVEPKWSWSCRGLGPRHLHLPCQDIGDPRVADVALLQVRDVGHHTRIANADGEKVRLYPEDLLVGVFGNRYATNAFEGEVGGTEDLHLLTDAGMIGTVRSRLNRGRRQLQKALWDEAVKSGYVTDKTMSPMKRWSNKLFRSMRGR